MIWWTETMRIHNSQGPEGTTALSTGCPWWLRCGWTSTKLMSGFTLVTHCVRSMCYMFRWMGKKILLLGDSQMPTWFLTWFSARFSQWEPVDIFTGEMGVRINLRFSHEWEPIMRISSIFLIYIFWENWTGFSQIIYIQFSEPLCQLVVLLFIFTSSTCNFL
jgi:hypothetical protein